MERPAFPFPQSTAALPGRKQRMSLSLWTMGCGGATPATGVRSHAERDRTGCCPQTTDGRALGLHSCRALSSRPRDEYGPASSNTGVDSEGSTRIQRPNTNAMAKKILVAIRPHGESTKGWTPRAFVPVTNHSSENLNEHRTALKAFWIPFRTRDWVRNRVREHSVQEDRSAGADFLQR